MATRLWLAAALASIGCAGAESQPAMGPAGQVVRPRVAAPVPVDPADPARRDGGRRRVVAGSKDDAPTGSARTAERPGVGSRRP